MSKSLLASIYVQILQTDDEATSLRQEVKSLRDQLQRSLLELKAYQTKYPSAYIHDIKLDESLPPWITSSEIMTPLLVAYDSSKTCICI